MQLWNDYEGKTIAEAYTLGPLLRPEGRSALFTLPKGLDGPAILRLTESLNDEGQMFACWRKVSEIRHENLLALKRFGQTDFEGTPLTYAVMEAPDATLAELLAERPMTHAEAMQVATSIVPVLKELHARELVHEHLQPENVVAIGETVKLRADCVRECKVDADLVTAADCANMRQRDVEALGLLLLRALTLEKKLRPGLILPAPFDRIIQNAVNGMWGLAEIAGVLPAPVAPPAPKPAPVQTPAQSTAAARPVQPPIQSPATNAAQNLAGAQGLVASSAAAKPTAAVAGTPLASSSPVAAAAATSAPSGTGHPGSAVVDPPLMFQRRIQASVVERRRKAPLFAGMAAAAAVLLAILLWVFHGSSAPAPAAVAAVPASTHAAPQSSIPQRVPVAASRPAAPVRVQPGVQTTQGAAASEVAGLEARLQPGWYVIAYTFNHEQQAVQRAEALVKRYPGLHPQVIAPHGRTFLIALGGAMSRDQAESILNMARRAGMPRDTFVRNYGG